MARPGYGKPGDYPGDPLATVKTQVTEWTDGTHTALQTTWVAADGLDANSVWIIYMAGVIIDRIVAAYTYNFTVPTAGVVPNIAIVAVPAACDPDADYDPLGGGAADSNVYPVRTLTVTSGSGSGSYKEGTIVHINANAVSNKLFSQWTGDTERVTDDSQASTTWTAGFADATITATYNDVLTANFKFPVNDHDSRSLRRSIEYLLKMMTNIPTITGIQSWVMNNFLKTTNTTIPREYKYPSPMSFPTVPQVYGIWYTDNLNTLWHCAPNSSTWEIVEKGQ